MLHKKTKIVCTLGPSSQDPKTLEQMVRSGMNVARLNFSHGDYRQFQKIIKNIRSVAKKLNQPVAIMQDLQGPKIRIGEMPADGIMLKKGQTIVLTTKKIQRLHEKVGLQGGNNQKLPVQYAKLPQDVQKGDHILIDDGQIELQVINKTKTDITCHVIIGGIVKSHKGINVPTASITAKALTEKDKKDLAFGLEHDVDYVALSFVKSAQDIHELRTLITRKKSTAKIIAKIERHEAVENLEEIIDAADGVMVARGDLGVEIPAEKVPMVQKKIIHLANLHGKPVITATQILQSMVENAHPTRAEISDAANAVFDHTDALMLSNETATGKYPVEATQTLAKVAHEVEKDLQKHQEFLPQRLFKEDVPIAYATCAHAAKLAVDIQAKMVVALTSSGFTAQHVAKHRIYIPIVVLTSNPKVKQELALVWGLNKIFTHQKLNKNFAQHLRSFLIKEKLAQKGDEIVVISNASKEEKFVSVVQL